MWIFLWEVKAKLVENMDIKWFWAKIRVNTDFQEFG